MNNSIVTLITDLQKILDGQIKAAPRFTSRREFGIAFAAKRSIDILEHDDSIDDVITCFEALVEDDNFWIRKAFDLRDEAYYRGKLSIDEDVLGSLRSIKEVLDTHWMMTGTAVDKITRQPINNSNSTVKMWVVSGEDKLRIEGDGNKVYGDHYDYINIKFLPW